MWRVLLLSHNCAKYFCSLIHLILTPFLSYFINEDIEAEQLSNFPRSLVLSRQIRILTQLGLLPSLGS